MKKHVEVEVELERGGTKKLIIKPDEDPFSKAYQFTQVHGLDPVAG